MKREPFHLSAERQFLLKSGVGLHFFFAFVFLILRMPQRAAQGAAAGVTLCLKTLIPAMLPLLVLSAFFQRSALGAAAAKLAERPAQLLFGVSGAGAGTVLFSLLGGYPASTQSIQSALQTQTLSWREGKLLQYLFFCPSAAFTVGAVGGTMLKSTVAGGMLLLSLLLPMPLLSLPLRLCCREDAVPPSKRMAFLPAPEAFLAAVEQGTRTMLHICTLVCLFSVLPELLDAFPLPYAVRFWALALPEVTSGVQAATKTQPLPVVAGLLSFGGFCAHAQVLPTLRALRVRYVDFLLFRVCQAALSAGACFLLCRLFPNATAVFSGQGTVLAPSAASSIAVSVCLCCMCVLLLLGSDTVLKIKTRRKSRQFSTNA